MALVAPHRSDLKTETPVMAMLATLEEIANDNDRFEEMRTAFHQWRSASGQATGLQSMRALFDGLKQSVDVKQRWQRAKSLLQDHRNTVSDVWSWRDPMAALGVLYPLAVFLKNGKVSTELLVSEEPAMERK